VWFAGGWTVAVMIWALIWLVGRSTLTLQPIAILRQCLELFGQRLQGPRVPGTFMISRRFARR
jgi:hypothetical protein